MLTFPLLKSWWIASQQHFLCGTWREALHRSDVIYYLAFPATCLFTVLVDHLIISLLAILFPLYSVWNESPALLSKHTHLSWPWWWAMQSVAPCDSGNYGDNTKENCKTSLLHTRTYSHCSSVNTPEIKSQKHVQGIFHPKTKGKKQKIIFCINETNPILKTLWFFGLFFGITFMTIKPKKILPKIVIILTFRH